MMFNCKPLKFPIIVPFILILMKLRKCISIYELHDLTHLFIYIILLDLNFIKKNHFDPQKHK